MNQYDFPKVEASSAAEVCMRFDVQNEALVLLREGMRSREFVEALLANKQYGSGIDFIAHALAPTDAIWWGSLCLQQALGDNWSESERAACRAAVLWALQPTEMNRAAAQAPAKAAERVSSAGALAMAAFRTGGNLAPPNAPPVPPPPFAPAVAVAAAVKLACARPGPAKIAETQRLFLELGIGVAEGLFARPQPRARVRILGWD